MKNKLKVILYFILEFILTIIIFSLASLVLLKTTIYNPDFIKKEFNKTNYYHNLYSSINEEMSNYIVQSGLEENILNGIYTEDMIKQNIENIIDMSFNNSNRIVKVEKEQVKENLEANINNYLSSNNIEITDKESLNRFINQILDVYEQEISLSNTIELIQKIVNKTKPLLNTGLITLTIIFIILTIIIKIYTKENTLGIPLFATSILLIFINLLITKNININSIFIWDSNVSTLIRSIINHILSNTLIIGIFIFIIGVIDTTIDKLLINKK